MTELERGAHANTLPLAGPALTRLVRRSESSSHQDRQPVPNGYSACLTVIIMITCETGSAVGVTPSLKTPVLADVPVRHSARPVNPLTSARASRPGRDSINETVGDIH